MRLEEIVRFPLLTEKSTLQREEHNIIAFAVDPRANRVEIKRAVEELFDVRVAEVRVARMHGKVKRMGRYEGRRPDWKKAYVRLADREQTIDFFEGM